MKKVAGDRGISKRDVYSKLINSWVLYKIKNLETNKRSLTFVKLLLFKLQSQLFF
jgi:hypothetical protein